MRKKPKLPGKRPAVDVEPPSMLWTRPSRALRGPEPTHSRDAIAEAAVEIADTDGIDAVSMRRVAAEMGTRATSLYRYVRSKEEVLDLMVDWVTGQSGIPSHTGDWRSDLQKIAHHMRATIKRHHWMISVSTRSTVGPNGLAMTEATLRALDGRGLDIDDMLVIATAVATFARGYAAEEIAEQQAEARSGLGRERWMLSQAEYLKTIRSAGKHPLLMRIVDDAKAPHDPRQIEKGFDLGLACLLDGIAARLKT